ncbi:hypothetical protein [Nonomuraea recticatena]|uniref:ABC transporter substrate-binding protein n=1 Tax=Nonomuraea recticatena TaxID=46178 RepID=A0ABP6F4L3_9ACTN
MADAQYYEWFSNKFDYVNAFTWCSNVSPETVLAAYGIQAERAQAGTISEFDEFRILAGRLGNGVLVIQPNDYFVRATLAALSHYGPCLGVAWGDFVPPRVEYLTEGRLVTSFDPFDWDWDPAPDYASVGQWVATTPAGKELWEEDWGLATLITAEALCQAAVDDEWMQAVHLGVPS